MGQAALTVHFDGTGSEDPDGDTLSFAWDFGDPDPADNFSTEASPSHTYLIKGTYLAILTVSDGELTDSTVVEITVRKPGKN